MKNKLIPKRLLKQNDDLRKLDIKGYGGQDNKIAEAIFKNSQKPIGKSDKRFYDCLIKNGNDEYLIEIKKQRNDQWFDIGKYYKLSKRNANIIVVFIIYDKEGISIIAGILLKELLKKLCANNKFKEYGWSKASIKSAFYLKQEHPKLQLKAMLKVRDFVRNNKNDFQIIYNR